MLILKNFKNRIQIEKAIMAKELPHFRFSQSLDETYFIGWHTTSTRHNSYQLILVLEKYYPDEMPKLYVTSPLLLFKYNCPETINSLGTTHAFHSLKNGPGGCVQICHFKPETWDSSRTCVGVLMKGILWCDAYDVHLSTGIDIAEVLDKWKMGKQPNLQNGIPEPEWMRFSSIPPINV